jgi:hypothetical protein
MDMKSTLKGSFFSQYLPDGWDIERIEKCVSNDPSSIFDPAAFLE